MTNFGITSFGAYIPRLRLSRTAIFEAHKWMAPSLRGMARGSRAFCSWDEDAITMAVEAARDCLRDRSCETLQSISLASTTLPFADLQNSAIVANALGLPRSVEAWDAGHSQRGATTSLVQAFRARREALLIASERPLAKAASAQEMSYGAGAAAVSLGAGEPIVTLLGSASVTVPFVDRFRAEGAREDYFWEERWVRDEGYLKLIPEAASLALKDAGLEIADIDHFVMPSLIRGGAEAAAKKLRYEGTMAPPLDDGCGYTGAAHALLMLVASLEQAQPGDRILLIGFGQGADALVLHVEEAITALPPRRGVRGSMADRVDTDSYLRFLSFSDGIDLEWGMRAERDAKTILTEQFRSNDQLGAFVAGKCPSCSVIQFPQLQYCVNCSAPAAAFDQLSLIDEPFEVMTYTADWLSYYPAPPLYVGFVQFDNGARLLMEMVDVGAEGIDVGTRLRAVFRIKERDATRGYNRYFWKASPLPSAGE